MSVPSDTTLKSVIGLDGLSQPISYSATVISSYLIARMTYRVAGIDSGWPIVFTATSIAGMIALYCTTDLHATQSLAIETVPGAASAWFAIFYAIGFLPTQYFGHYRCSEDQTQRKPDNVTVGHLRRSRRA